MRRVGTSLPFDQDVSGLSTQLLHASGIGVDDFALYMALRNLRKAQGGGAQNYLVSWPYNPATIDASLAQPLIDQRLIMVPQIVPAGVPIDGVAWIQQTPGVYTPNNTNGVAAYTLDGVNFTRIATSGNVANIWTAAQAAHVQAFTAQIPPFGQDTLVWAAALYCRSAFTTAPALGASLQVSGGGISANTIGLTAGYHFQSDNNTTTTLLASMAIGAVTGSDVNRYWLAFYHNSV